MRDHKKPGCRRRTGAGWQRDWNKELGGILRLDRRPSEGEWDWEPMGNVSMGMPGFGVGSTDQMRKWERGTRNGWTRRLGLGVQKRRLGLAGNETDWDEKPQSGDNRLVRRMYMGQGDGARQDKTGTGWNERRQNLCLLERTSLHSLKWNPRFPESHNSSNISKHM